MITNYNYSQFITDCLESLVIQNIATLDVVVVDDNSSDDSLLKIEKWIRANKSSFRKVQLIVNYSNYGPSIARNIGIQNTSCEYCFILDADNLLLPNCLSLLSEALESSNAAFAYSIITQFGDKEECLSYWPWDIGKLKRGNYIDTMAMIRRSWLENIGFYSDNACTKLGWEDYDLWIKTALHSGNGIFVPQILSEYRVHSQSRTFKTQNPNCDYMMKALREEYPKFWMNDF